MHQKKYVLGETPFITSRQQFLQRSQKPNIQIDTNHLGFDRFEIKETRVQQQSVRPSTTVALQLPNRRILLASESSPALRRSQFHSSRKSMGEGAYTQRIIGIDSAFGGSQSNVFSSSQMQQIPIRQSSETDSRNQETIQKNSSMFLVRKSQISATSQKSFIDDSREEQFLSQKVQDDRFSRVLYEFMMENTLYKDQQKLLDELEYVPQRVQHDLDVISDIIMRNQLKEAKIETSNDDFIVNSYFKTMKDIQEKVTRPLYQFQLEDDFDENILLRFLQIMTNVLPSYFRIMENQDPFLLVFLDNLWKSVVLIIEKCYWIITQKIEYQVGKYEVKFQQTEQKLIERLSAYQSELTSLQKELNARNESSKMEKIIFEQEKTGLLMQIKDLKNLIINAGNLEDASSKEMYQMGKDLSELENMIYDYEVNIKNMQQSTTQNLSQLGNFMVNVSKENLSLPAESRLQIGLFQAHQPNTNLMTIDHPFTPFISLYYLINPQEEGWGTVKSLDYFYTKTEDEFIHSLTLFWESTDTKDIANCLPSQAFIHFIRFGLDINFKALSIQLMQYVHFINKIQDSQLGDFFSHLFGIFEREIFSTRNIRILQTLYREIASYETDRKDGHLLHRIQNLYKLDDTIMRTFNSTQSDKEIRQKVMRRMSSKKELNSDGTVSILEVMTIVYYALQQYDKQQWNEKRDKFLKEISKFNAKESIFNFDRFLDFDDCSIPHLEIINIMMMRYCEATKQSRKKRNNFTSDDPLLPIIEKSMDEIYIINKIFQYNGKGSSKFKIGLEQHTNSSPNIIDSLEFSNKEKFIGIQSIIQSRKDTLDEGDNVSQTSIIKQKSQKPKANISSFKKTK